MDKLYELSDFALFSNCCRGSIETLVSTSPIHLTAYHKGDVIAMQGNACRFLYLLCEGSVKTTMTNSDGKEFKLETLTAPEVLAPAFIYGSDNIMPVSVFAEGDCRLWIISKEGFFKAMQDDSAILRNFLALISDRSVFLSRKLNVFALQNLRTRFIEMVKQRGEVDSLQEAAFILGVARPSLSRVVSSLIEQGEIEKDGSKYKLKR